MIRGRANFSGHDLYDWLMVLALLATDDPGSKSFGVQAKPLRGRFASLDTSVATNGWQL